MPNILAIETSTAVCSVALDVNGQVFEKHENIPREHAQVLLTWVDSLLNQAKISVNDIDAFAFGCGPGGFTGVRIGVGVLQGLVLGANTGVIPISSLAALAQQAHDDHGLANALVIQDAKMGEVYWAAYSANAQQHMVAVIPDRLSTIDDVQPPQEGKWIRIGDMTDFEPCYPSAKAVLKLAHQKLKTEGTIDVSDALPVYLRNKDAWKKAK